MFFFAQRCASIANYEWYCGAEALLPFLQAATDGKRDARILEVGCGNSPLAADLCVTGGYGEITCIDFATPAVEAFRRKHPHLRAFVCDICDEEAAADTLTPASFDAVVEKATLDAIAAEDGSVWSPSAVVQAKFWAACRAICRCLRPGGVFLSVSHAQPHFRVKMLAAAACFAPHIAHYEVGACYFVYVLRRPQEIVAAE